MALDIAGIRDNLKARIEQVQGLRGADTIPAKPNPPIAVVNPGPDPFVVYNDAMQKGLTAVKFEVILVVGLSQGLDRAQNALDGYLSAGTGQASSVLDALNTAPAGETSKWDHLVVETATGYGSIDIEGAGTFGTARLSLTVRTPRT